jgi:diguanylate cyclase (GGDEF)-like protein
MAKERTEYGHREAARTDSLTGILNRRGFLEQSASSNRWAMDLRPTAVMLIDLDNFKGINDRFGHAIGDRVLRIFAESSRTCIPSTGLIGRWGGDEFAAVLYDTGREEAQSAAERMQATFRRLASDIDGHAVNATLSVGMVFSREGPLDLPALLVQADEALYLAKELGRNRIEVASPETVWKSEPPSADSVPVPLPAVSKSAA